MIICRTICNETWSPAVLRGVCSCAYPFGIFVGGGVVVYSLLQVKHILDERLLESRQTPGGKWLYSSCVHGQCHLLVLSNGLDKASSVGQWSRPYFAVFVVDDHERALCAVVSPIRFNGRPFIWFRASAGLHGVSFFFSMWGQDVGIVSNAVQNCSKEICAKWWKVVADALAIAFGVEVVWIFGALTVYMVHQVSSMQP